MSVGDSLTNWWEVVAAHAERDPDRVAVLDGDKTLTYRQVIEQSHQMAGWLVREGLRPGDRLGIHLRKGFEEIIATLAAVRLGSVFVNINPLMVPAQVKHIVFDAGIRILIAEPRRGAELLADPRCAAQLKVITQGKDLSAALDDAGGSLRLPASPGASQLAALFYTSGSTGRPKGVMHSHGNLLAFAKNVASYLKADRADRVMGLLPISFSYGFNQLLTTLYVGAALILQRAPFPAEIVKTIVQRGITGLAAVPSVWGQILAYLDGEPASMRSLRYVTNAGGKLSEKNALRLSARLPHVRIFLMYGSTEVFRSTYLAPEALTVKPGSIGRAIPNVEVYVVDAAGRLCGPGEQGELVHRGGGHVSQGYWNEPQQTEQRFRGCPALMDRCGDEKVYYSGDIVKLDEDGDLWFVGRSDWMIKSGGFRFSVEDVESILARNELVKEVAVVPVDDEVMGQVTHAIVVAREGGQIDAATLEKYCWKTMPSYMIPRIFHLSRDPLPLLSNGKLDRVSLRLGITNPAEGRD